MQLRAWPSTPALTHPQDQTDQVRELQTRMPAVVHALDGVVEAEAECLAANIDENDHTVFACPDLQFELELLEQAIAKKALFLENQVRPSHSCHTGDTDLA
jgi:3-hydroxy-3-methylglutaryl CoA synthase